MASFDDAISIKRVRNRIISGKNGHGESFIGMMTILVFITDIRKPLGL